MSAARLQGHIKRRALGLVAAFLRVVQGFNLRMRQPGAMMPAAADDFATSHEHRPHERIRRGPPITFARQLQGQPQVTNVR